MGLLIISGGQSGADLAGWKAAKRLGIPTTGWMPKGYLTEYGPRPEYAELYGAKEHSSPKYPPRTRANIRDSDVTLIFDCSKGDNLDDMSAGTRLAVKVAMELSVQALVVRVDLASKPEPKRPKAFREWCEGRGWKVYNIAGNRESKSPGIGAWVEDYLVQVFQLLLERQT